MDLDSPKWTSKIWTSLENYGFHQMALLVQNYGLSPLKYGLRTETMDFGLWTIWVKYNSIILEIFYLYLFARLY